MHPSRPYVILRYLPICVNIVVVILVPYFYSLRVTSNIFKADFYLIWIAGCLSWLGRILFFPIEFTRFSFMVAGACGYVFLSYLLNSFFDESSLFAFLTLVSILGIVSYFNRICIPYHYHSIFILVLTSYVVQLCIGSYQAVTNGWRSLSIKGMLGNSGFYANYLASMIPLLVAGFVSKQRTKFSVRPLLIVIFVVASILVGLTLARAAYLGVLAGCIVVLAYHFKGHIQKRRLVLCFAAMGFFLVIVSLLYHLKPGSALGRQTIYKVSLNIIHRNLLIGAGTNRFSAVYNSFQAEYFKGAERPIQIQLLATDTFEGFNSLLQVLAEYGIIGLSILVIILFHCIKNQLAVSAGGPNEWIRAGSAGCVISTIVTSFFSNPFHVTPLLLIFGYHISNLYARDINQTAAPRRKQLFGVCMVMAFTIIVLFVVTSRVKAERVWQQASEIAKYNDFQTARPLYDIAYPTLKRRAEFLFNYGAEASLAGDDDLAIMLLEGARRYTSFSSLYVYLGDAYRRRGQFASAERNYLQAVYTVPSHIYPRYQLVQLYKEWKRRELAEAWTMKTLQFPVKVKNPLTELLLRELAADIKK